MHYGEDSTLNLYGDMAEKLLEKLSVGDKVTFTVSGKVEELSSRESMEEIMNSPVAGGEEYSRNKKRKEHYCVMVAITSVK